MNSVSVELSLNKGRFVKVLKLMGLAAAVVGGSVFSQGVLAACTYTYTLGHIINNPAQITLQDPDAEGLMGSYSWTASGVAGVRTCTVLIEPLHYSYQSGYSLHSGSGSGGGIYASGIPGLGMKIISGQPVYEASDKEIVYPDDGSRISTLLSGLSRPIGANVPFRVEFYKIGDISSGGVITNSSLLAQLEDKVTNVVFFQASLGTPITVILPKPTCTATSTNPDVPLDPVSSADFGPDDRAKSKNFSIDLNCTGGGTSTTDVSVTLTDATPGRTGGARLVPAAGSTAKGVELEIHKNSENDNSLQFGTPWLAVDDARAGQYQIPLWVNYYKTGVLEGGDVKASMTYTLDYQ